MKLKELRKLIREETRRMRHLYSSPLSHYEAKLILNNLPPHMNKEIEEVEEDIFGYLSDLVKKIEKRAGKVQSINLKYNADSNDGIIKIDFK